MNMKFLTLWLLCSISDPQEFQNLDLSVIKWAAKTLTSLPK